jgi:hypothetical protein
MSAMNNPGKITLDPVLSRDLGHVRGGCGGPGNAARRGGAARTRPRDRIGEKKHMGMPNTEVCHSLARTVRQRAVERSVGLNRVG